MLRGVACGLALFLSTAVAGQAPLLPVLWEATPKNSQHLAQAKLARTLEKTDRKQLTNDFDYLRQLFQTTHRTTLKTYRQYANLDEILSGSYDCLTATAWFSALLQQKGYDFDIIETNYHIFLMVRTSKGEVLLETTDRFDGFETNLERIQARIGSYRSTLLASSSQGQLNYRYSADLFRKIEPSQLKGLLYFNQAVKAYNARDWKLCARKLNDAKSSYETPRVAELAAILLQTLPFTDTLNTAEKLEIRGWFKEYEGILNLPLASR